MGDSVFIPNEGAAPAAPSTSPQGLPAEGAQSWAGGKFNSAKDMESAYTALEAKFTQTSQQLAAAGQPAPAAAPVAPAAPAAGIPAPAAPALDINAYSTEFAQTGALSEVSMSAIMQSTGLPRATISQFMQGSTALATQTLGQGHTRVGGEEAYNAITAWGAQAAPQDVQIINGYLQSGQSDQWLMALDGLKQRYEMTHGQDPTNPAGGLGGFGQPGAQGFNGHEEVQHAMSVVDENGQNRYESDPQYREDVIARIAVSGGFEGIQVGPIQNI